MGETGIGSGNQMRGGERPGGRTVRHDAPSWSWRSYFQTRVRDACDRCDLF